MERLAAPLEVVADGLTMTEGPRWLNGRLYFSDMFGGRVCAVDEAGRVETVARFDDKPSGLGFLPNGDLLVVQMRSAKVMRVGAAGISQYADISAFADAEINDMVIDQTGRAYIGQMGFDYSKGEAPKTTSIVVIEPDGAVRIAADGLMGPNGIVISADGGMLITGESAGYVITAFDRDGEGRLSNRRVFAQPPAGHAPDGICLDSDGGVWAAVPVILGAPGMFGPGVMRFEEGGRVTHVVPMPENRRALACMFGGADRQSLYICTAEFFSEKEAVARRAGRIERVKTDFTGAGLP